MIYSSNKNNYYKLSKKLCNKWTKEKCCKITKLYNNARDFKKEHYYLYKLIFKYKWFDLIEHMTPIINENNWTKEKCLITSKLYKNKKEFREKSEHAYRYALKNNIIDEICEHMEKCGNNFNRCVYAYIFSDNHVYVGLTYNLYNRNAQHYRSNTKRRSVIYEHMYKTKLNQILIQISNYINKDKASVLEYETISFFKEMGYTILNKAKPGGLGGNTLKWTKEKCKEVALLCKTKKEFRNKFPTANNVTIKNKWDNEVCNHLLYKKKNKRF